MQITRDTLVKDAVRSSKQAPGFFKRHSVSPEEQCSGMYDMISLDEAEEWCKVKDMDGLIKELNAALEADVAQASR